MRNVLQPTTEFATTIAWPLPSCNVEARGQLVQHQRPREDLVLERDSSRPNISKVCDGSSLCQFQVHGPNRETARWFQRPRHPILALNKISLINDGSQKVPICYTLLVKRSAKGQGTPITAHLRHRAHLRGRDVE
jgi:hypothetical protein